MRDVISGEYLPLTIEQFCNILPGDGDEMVAPSQAINRENSPIRPVRGEKGADSRHRNGLVITLEKSTHKLNLVRAITPDSRTSPSALSYNSGGHGRLSWNRVQS
ncbi:hypothetical protein ALC62_11813 [Cyphomyrmex costatus]|uniref:Uncharacterized protein n=1 Tax=Cyphomyrmex costatus TaxID=456900 RepID=A0A195C9I0_9HYME|nr:hypothetical protein ALC62_11813 [Cyphomyrmex costatus]